MKEPFGALGATLEAWEARATGLLPPLVRRNMRIEIVAAMLFGPFVAGLGFLPVVLRRLGASPEWIAFYLAQNFIGFLLTSVSVLVMPRREGLLRFGMTFWVISRGSFVLIAFINGAQALGWLTLFFWIAESFPVPVYTRLMQIVYPARSRGRVLALIRVGMSTTSLLATPLAGWLLDTAGYQVLYPVVGGLAALSALVFSRLQFADADVPESAPANPSEFGRILREDRRFVIYLAGLILFGVGLLSGAALYPLVQVDQLGLSYSEIGWLGLVQSVFFLAGYPLWGRLIDRRGGVWVTRLVFLIAAVIPTSYMLATSGWMLVPAFAALGLVNAGLDIGALNTVMQLTTPERLGQYAALQTTVLGLRGLAAPFIGVWLAQTLALPFAVVFGLGLVLILAGAALLLWVRAEV